MPLDADLAGFFLFEQLVLQDFFAAELVSAMHDSHVAGDIGQIKRFLNRRIAAADHGNRLVTVKEAVAGGAGRYAAAGKRFFRGQAEILRRGAGRNDQCVAGIGAGVTNQGKGLFAQLGGMDVVENDFGFEAFGMRFEALHQLRPLHALGVGRPVIHIGGGHQLATLGHAGNQHRFKVGTGGIDGRRVAGRAGTQDQQAAMAGCQGHFSSFRSKLMQKL